MYVKFRCRGCGEQSPATSFYELSSLWKNIYDKDPGFKNGFHLTAETQCICGEKVLYDGELFRYMFGIIFQQLVLNKKA